MCRNRRGQDDDRRTKNAKARFSPSGFLTAVKGTKRQEQREHMCPAACSRRSVGYLSDNAECRSRSRLTYGSHASRRMGVQFRSRAITP